MAGQENDKSQGERVIFVTPPTGGLNLYDNPLALDPKFASEYVNFMPPTGSGIMVRPGIKVIKELDGIVNCMYSYVTPASTVYTGNPLDAVMGNPEIETLLIKVQTPNSVNLLYEINPYASPASLTKIGDILNNGFSAESIIFMDTLYFLNDSATQSPYTYNHKYGLKVMTWQAPMHPSDNPKEVQNMLSGALINTVHTMALYKNLLYGSQKGTLNVFYIVAKNADINNVANYADEDFLGAYKLISNGWFSIMGVLTRGGDILKIFTFGSGNQGREQDLLCILTTKGELLVYNGETPSNLDTWRLTGHYYLMNPININCICPVEDDYIIVTGNGFVSLRGIISGSAGHLDDALSNRLSTLFSQYQFRFPEFTEQMFLQYYPKRRIMIFNVPTNMPIALSKALEGYTFDQNAMLTFGNEINSMDYQHSVKTFLATYILRLGVDYTVDYFLDTSRTNKIELNFALSNLELVGLFEASVDCTVTMGATINGKYYSWIEPIVYHCSNIFATPEVMTDTISVKSGNVSWSSSLRNATTMINDDRVNLIFTVLDPDASTDYEYEITDVFSYSSQNLIFPSNVNLTTVLFMPEAIRDMYFRRDFRLSISTENWNQYTPSISAASLVDFPSITSDFQDKVFLDCNTLAPTLARIAELAGYAEPGVLHSIALISRNSQGGIEQTTIEFLLGENLVGVVGSLYTENSSIITQNIYIARRVYHPPVVDPPTPEWYEWVWDTQPTSGYIRDYILRRNTAAIYRPYRLSSTPITWGLSTAPLYAAAIEELMARILIRDSQSTFAKLSDFLQIWFVPTQSSAGDPINYNVGYYEFADNARHDGRCFGYESLIPKLLSNIFRRYRTEAGFSLPVGTRKSVYCRSNVSFGATSAGTPTLQLPVRLEVYFEVFLDLGFPGEDRRYVKVTFVIYMGDYTLRTPAIYDRAHLIDFATKPYYCATCDYILTVDERYVDRKVGDITRETFTEVINNKTFFYPPMNNLVVQNAESVVLPNTDYAGTTVNDAGDIFASFITGQLFTMNSNMQKLWIQQFGWIYSTFLYVNISGDAQNASVHKSVSNTSKDITPFINLINIEKKYTSDQYVLDIQRGTWAQWKDVNMVSAVEHNSEFYFVRIKEDLDMATGSYKIKTSQVCTFDSNQDGDFEGDDMNPIEAYYKTGFTDLGAQSLKKFTKCKVFATASTFWTAYPYDLYYAIDFEDQLPVRYSGETIEAHLRKPQVLLAKPKMGTQLTNSEYRAKKSYLKEYANLSSNVKWVNIMTIAPQGTRIALGSRFYITEHNVIVWGYEVHFVPLNAY
jgi:hypothetical protein